MKNFLAIAAMITLGIFLLGGHTQARAGDEPPVNDSFSSAMPIVLSGGAGNVVTNNFHATKEAGEPSHADNVGGSSVWFKITPTATIVARINTTNQDFDTLLAVYTGNSVGNLQLIGSNDDCICTGSSVVDLKLNAGVTYYIAVDGYNNGAIVWGNFKIVITELATPVADNLQSAIYLGTSHAGSIAGTNFNATNEAGEPNHWNATYPGQKSVWYRWQPSASYVVRFQATEDFNSQMSVYESDSPNATFAQLTRVGAMLDFYGDGEARYHVTFFAKTGKSYYIVIAGQIANQQAPDTGNFQLRFKPSPMRYSMDMDGRDTASSIAVFRPSEGSWYIRNHGLRSAGYTILPWGSNGDTPMAADFDGDGSTEAVIARNENGLKTWYLTPTPTPTIFHWGLSTDKAVVGDFDGDGRADATVIRTTAQGYVWYVRQSSNGSLRTFVFGTAGDKPVLGNFDGQSGTDVAVARNTPNGIVWYVLRSGSNYASYYAVLFGATTDVLAPEDFDGDGKTDVAVFRPSTASWYILRSSTAEVQITTFGQAGDKPQPGDYDGDGKADLAQFRPSTGDWFFWLSADGNQRTIHWGAAGDIPVSSLATLSQ